MNANSFFLLCIFMLISPVLMHAQLMDKQLFHQVLHTQNDSSQHVFKQPFHEKDPLITQMVASVNADTIEHTLRELQNWGSRFALNDNHKAVATSLMQKFLSYGYTEAKLDSFLCVSDYDTTI
jgi:uncharacterized membrane protein YheB (UPF0754 family)